MERGISPVVATVLLIAIAVTAGMGVWYWMGSFTASPHIDYDLISVTISDCNGTHVLARNVKAEIADEAADIYNYSNNAVVGYIDFASYPLTIGNSTYVPIVNSSGPLPFSGTFYVFDDDYEDYTFTC